MARVKKQPTVTLITASGLKQAFSIQHAERLLDLGPLKNGGWMIDPDSDYWYDEENGIRLKPNKGNSRKA